MSGLKISPHLALVHKDQGGSANNRHVSLLLKAQDNLDEKTKELIKSVLGVSGGDAGLKVVEKASFEGLRDALSDAVRKEVDNYWAWTYVYDFDETGVVYSDEDKLYHAEYVMEDGVVKLSNKKEVTSSLIYEDESGTVLLSESFKSGESSQLLIKSTALINADADLLKQTIKNLGENMSQEGQKELTKALADLQKSQNELQDVLKEVELLKATVADFEEQKNKTEADRRASLVKSVQPDAEAASTLLKSLEALSGEDFDNVVEAMKQKVDTIEKSTLFSQTSVATSEDGESHLATLLKGKYVGQNK